MWQVQINWDPTVFERKKKRERGYEVKRERQFINKAGKRKKKKTIYL